MESRIYTEDELDEWRSWFERLDSPGPYHAPEYLSLLAGDFEYESERAEVFVHGTEDTFVYYPYIRRSLNELPYTVETIDDVSTYSDIVSSWYYGGPILSTDPDPDPDESLATAFASAFTEYCRDTGIIAEFVRFDPNIENHTDFDVLDPEFNRQTVPIDLTQSKETIWKQYEDRNQRAIKQAKESALSIDREYNSTDVKQFHEIYSNAMEARDAAEHYRFTLDFFQCLLETPLFSLVIARYKDELVGGFIIAHDEKYSHHYLSASNPDYWDYRVNNLMYHEAVQYMHDTGREVFDFQGGRPGVFKFKKGFSPDRGEFYISKQIHMPDVYDAIVEAASAAGIDTESGYFPAYRIEQSN
jgi:hypothetical protein